MAPRKRRPAGVSSRMTRVRGERHPWRAGDVIVDLPVVVDWVDTDADTGEEVVRIEATIDLVEGSPEIVSMSFVSAHGLDVLTLQRDFRWASPLEVVTGLAPRLMAEGVNPYAVDLPVTDFPASAIQPVRVRRQLSDEFLTTVAREYLVRGRGYAASLAEEYFVSTRTVVSWVEKARARGLLSGPPTRGAAGGELLQ